MSSERASLPTAAHHVAVVVVLAIGLALSWGGYSLTRSQEERRLQNEFRRRVDVRHATFAERLNNHVEALYAVSVLFLGGREPDAATFSAAAAVIRSRNRAVTALEWVPRILPAERAAFEARAAAALGRPYLIRDRVEGKTPTLVPSPVREEHFPILYIDPMEGNAAALGYDLKTAPSAAILERARATGSIALTGRIPLVQDAPHNRGIILVLPVFGDAPVPGSDAPPPFRGFIQGVFQLDSLLSDAAEPSRTQTLDTLVIDDGTADSPDLPLLLLTPTAIISDPESLPSVAAFRSGPYRERNVFIGGRNWRMVYRPSERFGYRVSSTPLMLLIGGIAGSLLLAGYLRQSLRRQALVRREVDERTAELRRTQTALEADIARRTQAERALAAAEERYRAFIEQSREPVWRFELEVPLPLDLPATSALEHLLAHSYVAEGNDTMARLHGRERAADLVHLRFGEIFDAADPVNRACLLAFLGSPGLQVSDVECREVDASSRPRVLLTSITGIIEGGHLRRAWVVQRDVTERRTAERSLEESRQLLDSLMGQLPGMAMRCLPGPGRVPIYVSPGVLTLTGYTADDVLAGRVVLADRIHAEDRPAVVAAAARALAESSAGEIEYRFFTRDDRERWLFEHSRCLLDADGTVKFVDILAIDITAQKRAERDKLQLERRILENRHLESLSLLAGGIAHDFNNLLTAISGNATLIALDVDPDSPAARHLSEIQAAVARAGELCTQLLGFAGGGSHDIQRTDLRALIEECAPALVAGPMTGIRLETEFGETVPEVLADREQLREVLGHLVSNAADALGGRPGVVVLSAREAVADDTTWENAVLTPGNRHGHFALLECRDTGTGMSEETRTRIFDPFFSTKHEGRGLGLPAVLGVVRSHQGGIVVSSRAGEGTLFRIYLPAIQATSTAAVGRGEAPAPEAVRPRRCLLVVDDEASVRGVIRRLLERHGYETLEASDGEEGIAAFSRDAHRIDLVLLDLTMPRVGGEEVLRRIRLTHPRTPVVLMSGYSRVNAPLLLADGSVTRFLAKPFSLAQLQEQIRRFLG